MYLDESLPSLFIIRGISGSGKSTLARRIAINHPNTSAHFEADMYFTDNSGQYSFDASKLADAHAWCLQNVENAMDDGKIVIVSNTFTTIKEIAPYMALASKYSASTSIIHTFRVGTNNHGVPHDKVMAQLKRWEDLPIEWLKYAVSPEKIRRWYPIP